jgi:hypothetical protein
MKNQRTTTVSRKGAGSAAAAATAPALEPEGAAAASEREQIEQLAYSYWLERGGEGGSPEGDWLRAEAEIRQRRAG